MALNVGELNAILSADSKEYRKVMEQVDKTVNTFRLSRRERRRLERLTKKNGFTSMRQPINTSSN